MIIVIFMLKNSSEINLFEKLIQVSLIHLFSLKLRLRIDNRRADKMVSISLPVFIDIKLLSNCALI